MINNHLAANAVYIYIWHLARWAPCWTLLLLGHGWQGQYDQQSRPSPSVRWIQLWSSVECQYTVVCCSAINSFEQDGDRQRFWWYDCLACLHWQACITIVPLYVAWFAEVPTLYLLAYILPLVVDNEVCSMIY